MLDGRYLRDNLDAVRAALGARAAGWDFDRFVALDDERRRLIGEVEGRQALRNEASKTIGELMRTGQRDEAEAAKERVRVINEEIAGLDIPTAQPLVYEFDDQLKAIRHYYLGDQAAIKAAIEAVANQGKAK